MIRRLTPVALLLVLAGCGSAATTSQAAPTATRSAAATASSASTPTTGRSSSGPGGVLPIADACALLSLQEVTLAHGKPLTWALPAADASYVYCAYGTGRKTKEGELRTFVTANPATARFVFDSVKAGAGEAVPGVGDNAFWSSDPARPGLYLMKRGSLAYISGAAGKPHAETVELGKLLASRL